MALGKARVISTAQQIAKVARTVRNALDDVNRILTYNENQAIDWAAGEKPDYIPEDADLNLDGLQFSRQEVANAVFSLEQFQKVLKNEVTTKGDHLGNLNKVSDPE